jgi:Tol biopolymer transport system component
MVYDRFTKDRRDEIDIMNADGSGRRVLLFDDSGGSFAQPSWSPDGPRIAFSDSDGPGFTAGIGVINVDGTD